MTRAALLAEIERGEQWIKALKRAAEAIEDPEAARVAPQAAEPPHAPPLARLAWGGKVSQVFRERIAWVASDLDIGPRPGHPEPSWLMTCIAWESGRTFSAAVKNMAGSGAVGLIQFMPDTARGLGTTTAALAAMTPEDQINWVWRYFKPWKGRLRSLADLYMAILWPKGVGHPEGYVLWDKTSRPTTYRQNAGLDIDRDGEITKAEATAKVAAMLVEGMAHGTAL